MSQRTLLRTGQDLLARLDERVRTLERKRSTLTTTVVDNGTGIIGPPGADGADGAPGANGTNGAAGAPGPEGPSWPRVFMTMGG